MTNHASSSAPLEPAGDLERRVTIRVGRQGKTWHAVASVQTPAGPILFHARADQRALLRAIVRNGRLRRWIERASHGAIAPGALDELATQIGFSFGDAFKAFARFKPLAKVVDNVAHGRVLQDVTRQVGKIASSLPKTLEKATALGDRALRSALSHVVNNPVWDIARTGVSFIPGVGAGVSAGMAATAAYGRNQSARDIALAAARGALPGGDLAKLAWDVGVGLGKSPRLDRAAVQVVGRQLGNVVASRLGPVAGAVARQAASAGDAWVGAAAVPPATMDAVRSAFKAGLTVARTRGRPLNRSNAVALARSLPQTPIANRVAQIATRAMVESHYRERATVAYDAAQKLVRRLDEREPSAVAEYRALQAQAAEGQHKPRVALAVVDAVRRTNAVRANGPALQAARRAG